MNRHQEMPDYFGELCELISVEAPETSHRRTTDVSIDSRYWLELYRWIEFEESYDQVVEEFAPPRTPAFKFSHITRLRNRIENDLEFVEMDGTSIDDILIRLGAENLALKDKNQPTCLLAPFIHPEVEASENSPFVHGKRKHPQYPTNKKLTQCLAPNTQAVIILAGHAPRIQKNCFIFARLKAPVMPVGVVEVPFPISTIIVTLTPKATDARGCIEDGRMLGTFMIHKKFRETMKRVSSPKDILIAVDMYLSRLNVETQAPTTNRIHNDSEMSYWSDLFKSDEQKRSDEDIGQDEDSDEFRVASEDYPDDAVLKPPIATRIYRRLCPPGRDFYIGIKEVFSRYISDFTDAFKKANISVCFSSIPLVFFVVFAPAITFGTIMRTQVNPDFSVSNSILASGITSLLYACFAGQPIAIIGPSGPGFIMERLIRIEADNQKIDFWMFRFWTLLYTTLFGIVFIALNLSNLCKKARRSVEELFSAFVSAFLIVKALFAIFRPILETRLPNVDPGNTTEAQVIKLEKASQYGVDAFIALLMMCTCLVIAKFKVSHLTRRKIRNWIGALNVPISICLMIAVERIFFPTYHIRLLEVPPVAKINYSTWFTVPDFNTLTVYQPSSSGSVHGMAFLYGFLLAFMLFVEIGLNSIVALRGGSIKPSPASIDHLLTNVVFPFISMFIGLPVVSGVPVRTIANMMSLVKVNPNPAPGDEGSPWYLVEQRVNAIITGILVILSVFVGDFLCHIPVASLFGMFIYLGIFGLKGLRYKQIFVAMLSRKKYWSQWNILDGIPRRFVYIFTSIWTVELIIMLTLLILGEWAELSAAGAVIPFVLVLASIIREVVLPRCGFMRPYLDRLDPLCVTQAIKTDTKKKNDDYKTDDFEEDSEKTTI